MCHIQIQNSKYFAYPACLFRIGPPLSEKIRNVQNPIPFLVRKKSELWRKKLSPLCQKIKENGRPTPPPLVADIICEQPLMCLSTSSSLVLDFPQ